MATPAQVTKMRVMLSKVSIPLSKEEIVSGISGGRTKSLTELDQGETKQLITFLNKQDPNYAKVEKMRRKIISLAHEMQWYKIGTQKVDMKRVDGWCLQFGSPKKKLDDYSCEELTKIVFQFKKAYKHYIKNI